MEKQWRMSKKVPSDFIKQFPEINPVVVQLLWNRKLRTQDAVDQFLSPDYQKDTHDPFLFRDMQKAVDRILRAKEQNENVVIYGDYDADGVSGSALLYEMLGKLGLKAHVHLPHREKEGYGLNMAAAEEFVKKGFQLVITCDCGISNVDEVALLEHAGVNVIITDHHSQPPVIPSAFAILNPHIIEETYPYKDLVGTGVAYKLAQGLFRAMRKQRNDVKEGEEKWLLDLVAIATIADFGPLIGENRTLVKYGLMVLEKTRRLGITALLEKTRGYRSLIDSETISFQLVPRLNAASRMDHANTAFELLIEKDFEKARALATILDGLNSDRQKVSENMFKEGKKQIGTAPDKNILSVIGKDWQAGLVGLVAGKLLHVYDRPVIVMGENGTDIVGSGRSTEQFDITKALEKNKKLLEKFGGHPQACGFSLKKKNLAAFVKAMEKEAEKLEKNLMVSELLIDAEVPLDTVSWDLWEGLGSFEPFGEGNRQPLFVSRGVFVEAIRQVGSTGKHLQVMVRHNSEQVRKTIAFGFAPEWTDKLPQGTTIDIAYEVSVNEWNGNRELQIKLVDIHMVQ